MNAAEQELDNLIFVTSLQAPTLQRHSSSPVTKNSAPAADSSCHHKCSANPRRTPLEEHPLDHTRHPHTPRTSGHHQPLAQDAPAHHPPRNHETRRTRHVDHQCPRIQRGPRTDEDRKSTRLNSSHVAISYAVFCLKKKTLYSYTL